MVHGENLFARIAGLRIEMLVTIVPWRIRSVCAARADTSVHPSRKGSLGRKGFTNEGELDDLVSVADGVSAYPEVLALCRDPVLRPSSRSAPEKIRARTTSVPPMR
jgi:hypothetical protein